MTQLARARLVNVTTSLPGMEDAIEVLFNPTEYSLSRENDWKSRGIGLTSQGREAEFTKQEPMYLSLKLYLDNSLESGLFVLPLEGVIAWLLKLTEVPPGPPKPPGGGPGPHPPMMRFEWGRLQFQGVIRQFDLTCKQFGRSGDVRRAEVDLKIMECHVCSGAGAKAGGTPANVSVIKGEELVLALAKAGLSPKGYRAAASALGIADPLKI